MIKGVIHLGLRPRQITPSSMCLNSSYPTHPLSLIAKYTFYRSDNHDQVADKEKGGGFGTNQPVDGDDHEHTHDNEENDSGLAKNNETSSKMEKEYFEDYNGNKMTVVFHAVLAPHFKFDPNLGDKIYMRFGGEMFGHFKDNVLEVIHQR